MLKIVTIVLIPFFTVSLYGQSTKKSVKRIDTLAVKTINYDLTIADQQAEPKNGVKAFYDSIMHNLIYPRDAIKNGIHGTVYVQFIIEKDGSLSNIKALKGIGSGCDEAAVKAVKDTPDWHHAWHNGKPVRSQRVVPIKFILPDESKKRSQTKELIVR